MLTIIYTFAIQNAILEGQGDGYPISITISGDEEWLMFGVEVDEEDEEYFSSGNYCLVIPSDIETEGFYDEED